jgi:colanic acid biosynthesis glycosyl transferase WcaI
MTLIFINRYFHPDHSATSQMLSDLAFGLSERGHDVRVIASRQRYDSPCDYLQVYEIVEGVETFRLWTSRFGRGNLIGRAVDYATFYVSAAWSLCWLARPDDIIIAKTDPPMLSVIVAPIARWRGARLVNWLQDLFPDVAEVIGLDRRRLSGFVYGALRRVRNWSLYCAAANVVLGDRMAERLATLGVTPARISVIANWIDADLVKPIAPEDNSLRREWGLDDEFVVGYSGNLGRAHDYETMLDAIIRLDGGPEDTPKIRWLFVGGGALYEALANELRVRGLKSVIFKPYQPRERLAQSLSVANIHLASLRPELEGMIVPSKFYGIAAAGRPTIFIGNPDGELARIVRRNGLGYVTAQGDGAALASLIVSLARDPDSCTAIGARAREVCEREFDKRTAIDRWDRLLTRIAV